MFRVGAREYSGSLLLYFGFLLEIPYISVHDFAAINDWMRTRVRHFDPIFWQCLQNQVDTKQSALHLYLRIPHKLPPA